MAKFLNTSATTFYLEELIKNSCERLVLISPYLKLNDRIKELLEDKNRMKIDIRLVYGKSDLRPREAEWIADLNYVRTSFCKNLHAKCYLNEASCIITSLNLYEFSQVNNNEMGVLIEKEADAELYRNAYEEAQRIIRISDEDVPLAQATETHGYPASLPESSDDSEPPATELKQDYDKLTTSRLAKKFGMKTADLEEKLVTLGYLAKQDGQPVLTPQGMDIGAEFKKGKYKAYFLWPSGFEITA